MKVFIITGEININNAREDIQMLTKFKITILFFLCIGSVRAQIGGQHAFQFLDLDFNARAVALGGDYIVSKDNDLNLAVANPSLITDKMDKNVAFNQAFYPSGINFGQLVLGKKIKSYGVFTGHLRYVAYGKFQRTDVTGQNIGKFSAGDYAVGIGYGKTLNERISIGANLNFIFSHYESYIALGTSIDFGATFYNADKNFTATILARNVGFQFKGYTKKNREPLPIEILAGISYKLSHAPFRFSLMGHDLTDWDLSYNVPGLEPTVDQITGDTIAVPKASFAEKVFRHINIGVEILPTDHFSIRLGYNYDRRKTFVIEDRISITGFSAGIGFRLKKLDFNYSVAFMSPAGSTNMISVTSNFGNWRRKKG